MGFSVYILINMMKRPGGAVCKAGHRDASVTAVTQRRALGLLNDALLRLCRVMNYLQ